MGFEIDFLPVGEGESGGDAIALRYGNLYGPPDQQTVIIIDGGYTDSGEALVDHILRHYGTSHVHMVVSTHSDQDHISGLKVVLEKLSIGQLIVHLPWRHSTSLEMARSSAFRDLRLSEKLERSFTVSDLEAIAYHRNIPIVEPFAGIGTRDGCFRIVGPSREYYEELLPAIASPVSTLQKLFQVAREAKEAIRSVLVEESLIDETLRDDGVTTANNNSSVISMFSIDGRSCLFTADAGIQALEQAVSLLETDGFGPGSLRFVQVPHHGSRRNIGPSVLDRLLGPKGQTGTHSTAFVSAPPENPEEKHPAKKVTNAFTRRGYATHVTQGIAKRYPCEAPDRPGYGPSTPVPLYTRVEEDSET